jgi:hypothetical protein
LTPTETLTPTPTTTASPTSTATPTPYRALLPLVFKPYPKG